MMSKKESKKEVKKNGVMGEDTGSPDCEAEKAEGQSCQCGQSAENELRSQLEQLQARLAETESKRDDYLLTAQRVQAEFENFKKRTASVRAEAYDDGMRQIASDILPVFDNFERALKSASDLKAVFTEEAAAFHEGVEMIAKQLLDALSRHSLEVVNPIGEVFDAEVHNAAMQSPAEDGQEPGTIVDVFQKGYKMKGKMIRYAMVRVAGE